MLRIICIGKKHDPLFAAAINEYSNRLSHFDRVEWVILSGSSHQGDQARVVESQAILSRITADDFVVLLAERGEITTSEKFATTLEQALNQSRRVTCVIGGAYGVSEPLQKRADFTVAFGKTVFPHQLIRLMLTEQLYRSFTIIRGLPYHNT